MPEITVTDVRKRISKLIAMEDVAAAMRSVADLEVREKAARIASRDATDNRGQAENYLGELVLRLVGLRLGDVIEYKSERTTWRAGSLATRTERGVIRRAIGHPGEDEQGIGRISLTVHVVAIRGDSTLGVRAKGLYSFLLDDWRLVGRLDARNRLHPIAPPGAWWSERGTE